MKFENEHYWLTGKLDNVGKELYKIDVLDVYGYKQSQVYYGKGIKEIDEIFSSTTYIDERYVTALYSCEHAISLYFFKYGYRNGEMEELAGAHIARDKILRFEKSENQPVYVVKSEEAKHKNKMLFNRSAGLVGSIAEYAGGKMFGKPNTHTVSGTRFYLYYQDMNESIQCLEIYAEDGVAFYLDVFINTYYKKELDESAQEPISKSSDCFIATACYKDMFAPELVTFRNYRDSTLKRSYIGRVFIRFYYFLGPRIYVQVGSSERLSSFFKKILDIIFHRLSRN